MATDEADQFASAWQYDWIAMICSALWDSASSHSIVCKDIAMLPPTSVPQPATPNAGPQNSESVPVVPRRSHARHGACTHIKMERLYGSFLCSCCHRPASFGWVYSCLQNDEDYSLDDRMSDQNSKLSSVISIAEQQHHGLIGGLSDEKSTDALRNTIEPVSFQPANLQRRNSRSDYEQPSIVAMIRDSAAHNMTIPAGEELSPRSESVNLTGIEAADGSDELPMPEGEFGSPLVHPRLNPRVEKAIKDGHYSPEQVVKMRLQRQRVIDVINAAKENARLHSRNGNNPHPSPKPMVSQSIEANSFLPFPVINEIQEISEEPNQSFTTPSKTRLNPFCMHRACHNCRPTYIDRAWVRLDEVLAAQDPVPYPDLQTDNRPISDVNVVRNIDFRRPMASRPRTRLRRRSYFTPENGLSSSSRGLPRELPPGFLASDDHVDRDMEIESKGFRESMKRAFRTMLSRRRDSFSARSCQLRRTKDMSTMQFDMALWRELNDELLLEASNIPLPGHDGMDGLSDDESEVEVEGGVAVTEEGIDLGAADIIMFV